MADNHANLTGDYLLGTQAVLESGRRLRRLLEADAGRREYAITQLERAASQQSDSAGQYQAFMFTALEDAPVKEEVGRLEGDTLASVLQDLQVANVLLAAGQAVGEAGGDKAQPKLLDEALLRLDNTSRITQESLASPLDAGDTRLGFLASSVEGEAPVSSPDLPTAKTNFKSAADGAVSTLVGETQGVATSIFTALSKIDGAKVQEALAKLGVDAKQLPKVGRLFRWGIEKLEGAINALIRLLGNDALAAIKEKVKQVWEDVMGGKYLAQVLEWVYGVVGIRTKIEGVVAKEGLQQPTLDTASNTLNGLMHNFKENMSVAQFVISAVGFAGAILAFLLGPGLALTMASIYVLVLGAVLLIGRDYAGAGGRVRGIEAITGELLN